MRKLLILRLTPKTFPNIHFVSHSVKPTSLSRTGLWTHQRARRGQHAKVVGIYQLIIASLRLLSSGELRMVSRALPTLGPNAARMALRAARAVCRLPPVNVGGRLKNWEEEFFAPFLSSSPVVGSSRLASIVAQTLHARTIMSIPNSCAHNSVVVRSPEATVEGRSSIFPATIWEETSYGDKFRVNC